MALLTGKTISTIGILLAGGAMLAATAAMARGPGGMIDFAALDADSNGEITSAEFEAFKAAKIQSIDADGDGFITAEELLADREAKNAERAAKRFEKMVERLDTDADGKISIAEMSAMSGKRGGDKGDLIERLDTDGSGGVSAEEFEAAKSMRKDRGDKGKRRHGHGSDKDTEGKSE